MLTWICALALAVDPAELPSVDLAEEAELHFQLGAEAYSAGENAEALAHFLRSHRLAPNRSTAFNIARVYDELGRPEQAWRYYDVSLRGETDPELQAPARQAMRRLEPQIARVHVTSTPPGADVYVSNRELGSRGTTPMTLALLPGRNTVILQLRGYSPVELQRVFPGNGLFELDATLERAEADRRQRALAATWVESTVSMHGERVVHVADERCDVFPDRLSAVSTWREPLSRMPTPPPGSAIAAHHEEPIHLDVVVEDTRSRRTTRVPLTRGKKASWFDQADLLRTWVLDRCEITNGAAVGDALSDMKKKVREDVVALLAELRGEDEDTARAARRCVKKGDCGELAAALRF